MKKAIDRIVRYIVQVADPDFILLFGSMAEGRHDQYSDVDLLVVTRENLAGKVLKREISNFINESALKADVHIRSRKDVEYADGNATTFLGSILKSGKKVYEKEHKKFYLIE